MLHWVIEIILTSGVQVVPMTRRASFDDRWNPPVNFLAYLPSFRVLWVFSMQFEEQDEADRTANP